MKVVILAGGLGSRISEESHLKPKPMIEIGERPILWHIMKIYAAHGFNEFIICLGYKGYCIKEYFANYLIHESTVTFDFRSGEQKTLVHHNDMEPWCVTLAETGLDTMTGGRVKRLKKFLGNEPFLVTYGDGVGDIDISALVNFHKSHGKLVTVTGVQPTGRFGAMDLQENGSVSGFKEKPQGDGAWISAGFFVMQPEVLNFIDGDGCVLEREPLESIAAKGELMAYQHSGFWHPMDTLRDKTYLESVWKTGDAPWKVWDRAEPMRLAV